MVVPKGQVFRADFSQSFDVERCFLAGSSRELWKWHRKLGHLSFVLLSRLSKLNLVRGLPRLRLEKELVRAPCRHANCLVFDRLLEFLFVCFFSFSSLLLLYVDVVNALIKGGIEDHVWFED
jgi:hypothetical protein